MKSDNWARFDHNLQVLFGIPRRGEAIRECPHCGTTFESTRYLRHRFLYQVEGPGCPSCTGEIWGWKTRGSARWAEYRLGELCWPLPRLAGSPRYFLENEIPGEPCCCHACDNGVQPGHFLCENIKPEMLEMEREGKVWRALVGGTGSFQGPQRWAWFRCELEALETPADRQPKEKGD